MSNQPPSTDAITDLNRRSSTGGMMMMQPAPYPPMAHRNPSSTQLKSSLSSKPQYFSSGGTTADSSVASETDSKTAASGSRLACAARFCHPTLIAAINPAAAAARTTTTARETTTPRASAGDDENNRPRNRLGPVLLEIQRLTWNPTSQGLYTLETVAKSRGNPSLGTSIASTCLDVLPASSTTTATTATVSTDYTVQPCVTGLSTGALCLHSFPSSDWEEFTSTASGGGGGTTEYYHTGRHHRPATAVAWRPSTTHQVAIAWAAHHHSHHQGPSAVSSSASSLSAKRGAAGGVPVGGRSSQQQPHDRDFGCFIWDLQSHNTKVPLRRLGHQVGAANVGWIMEGHLLVLGSQLRTFQVFDLRSEQPASQPVTVYAHPTSVHVRADPLRPHQFATFSRGAAEPVKLWDARRVESSVGEIKYWNQHEAVSDVQWSHLQEGYLTLAVGDDLYDYDTSASRPVQTNMVSTVRSIKNFCLYPYKKPATTANDAAAEADAASEDEHLQSPTPTTKLPEVTDLYHNRAIVCFNDRSIRDVARHRLAPVAISKRDGRLAQALGTDLKIGGDAEGVTAMKSLEIRPDEDVSATMMRRAKCFRVARYSMDTGTNIELLSEESTAPHADKEASVTRESLLRMWIWVDRMESLFMDDDGGLPIHSLVAAGASFLLQNVPGEETMQFSDALSCSVYTSPNRRAALTSCGWAGKFDLSNVLAECEVLSEFERSAALAVWHGELGAGVQALQRGAASLRSTNGCYAEMLELVALCVAGFRGGSDPSLVIWRQACSNLIERSELSGENRSMSRVAYVRGLLRFLMNPGSSHQQVLGDDDLSLCDRVGFACRFLPRDSLQGFLDSCIEKCQQEGNIEGLTITGIDRTGIKILQAYVDRYTDVQTAALITNRVILPPAWEQEKWICVEWLDSYRSLLNTWQMWQSRAMFDVDRSELMRTLQAREATLPKGANTRAQPANRRLLTAVPFQMDARCTYCQQSLSLKQNNTNTNQWLREMNKSVLSCCPHCRSPLPRCAICMLSLGALNPFLELQARAGRPSAGRQSPDDLTTASNLPFAEWFSWCMRCKHGGHAHHMVGWFANHDVCPVSGCNCRCQF